VRLTRDLELPGGRRVPKGYFLLSSNQQHRLASLDCRGTSLGPMGDLKSAIPETEPLCLVFGPLEQGEQPPQRRVATDASQRARPYDPNGPVVMDADLVERMDITVAEVLPLRPEQYSELVHQLVPDCDDGKEEQILEALSSPAHADLVKLPVMLSLLIHWTARWPHQTATQRDLFTFVLDRATCDLPVNCPMSRVEPRSYQRLLCELAARVVSKRRQDPAALWFVKTDFGIPQTVDILNPKQFCVQHIWTRACVGAFPILDFVVGQHETQAAFCHPLFEAFCAAAFLAGLHEHSEGFVAGRWSLPAWLFEVGCTLASLVRTCFFEIMPEERILSFDRPTQVRMFLAACWDGNGPMLEALLKTDHSLSNFTLKCGEFKGPAVYFACLRGHSALIDPLISSAADANAVGSDTLSCGTPLWTAVVNNSLEAAQQMLLAKADPDLRGVGPLLGSALAEGPALFFAARAANVEAVRLLLQHGADPLCSGWSVASRSALERQQQRSRDADLGHGALPVDVSTNTTVKHLLQARMRKAGRVQPQALPSAQFARPSRAAHTPRRKQPHRR